MTQNKEEPFSPIEKRQATQILKIAFQECRDVGARAVLQKEEDLVFRVPKMEVPSRRIEFETKLDALDEIPIATFTIQPIEHQVLLNSLPKDLASFPTLIHSELQPSFMPKPSFVFKVLEAPQRAVEAPILPPIEESSEKVLSYKPQIRFSQSNSFTNLRTASYSEDFDTEIYFYPLDAGYAFTVTLVPRANLKLSKIGHDICFLIDRSNSIQNDRLGVVKGAVLKAIEQLEMEDSFNIIAFDSKIDKFSASSLPATKTTVKKAKDFLDKIQLGSFFSTSNLCKPLLLTVPIFDDEKLHTAILFSDGESLNKKMAQRELALDWLAYNHGRVSLFAIGVGTDAQLAALDAIATQNRGKIFYPPTNKGIKRKLLKLMKTVSCPIAKDLQITAISRSPNTKIELYPKTQFMPLLYQDEPYVIMGIIDKLEDFVLFLQGNGKEEWFNIKKNISFVNAKRSNALKAQWAMHEAYHLYEQHLYDLDPKCLAEANELLEENHTNLNFQ